MDRERELERIKLLLANMGKKPLRSYGQNFLLDRTVAEKIAQNVPDQHLDHVVEIGPGLGILTGYLLGRGAKVTAIEKDEMLASNLPSNIEVGGSGDLKIICGDAVKVMDDLLEEPHFIVSNLPFNISSKLMGAIIDNTDITRPGKNGFLGGLIMFQEEFSKRLISEHGSKEYGRISVMFRTKMRYRHVIDVGRSSFYPVPKVNASVIGFEPRYDHEIIPDDMKLFTDLVHVIFLNRRKKLRNSVNPRSIGIDLDIEDTRWILEDMGISDLRPEDLSPDDLILLSNRLATLR